MKKRFGQTFCVLAVLIFLRHYGYWPFSSSGNSLPDTYDNTFKGGTFRNKQFGFEIAFPTGWNVIYPMRHGTAKNLTAGEATKDTSNRGATRLHIIFGAESHAADFNFEQYVKDGISKNAKTTVEKLAGKEATKIEFEDENGKNFQFYLLVERQVNSALEKRVYSIFVCGSNAEFIASKNEIDAILSSFKLL